MTEPTSPTTLLDRAARESLDAIVAPIVHAHGGEVVDVEWKTESGGWVLRVFVEKQGAQAKGLSTKETAVTLELCANVARELSPALDAIEDMIPHAYSLEVSSPGVERALKTKADFTRFAANGDKAKLWLKKAALPRAIDGAEPTGNGSRVLLGRLTAFANDTIVLVDASRTYDIAFDDLDRARLVFELETGTKARPGKGAKTGGNKKPHPKTNDTSKTKSDQNAQSKTGEQP